MDYHCAKILNKYPFPIIIWKKTDESYNCYNCYYTNTNNIETNTLLENYLKNNSDKLNTLYQKVIQNKKSYNSNIDSKNIYIEYIDDNTLFEYEYNFINRDILSFICNKLRIALTNIVGIMSIINNDKYLKDYPKYYLKHIDIIKKSNYSIIKLVNNIYDYNELLKDNILLKTKKIKLHNLVKLCIDLVYDKANEKNITINFNIKKNVPQYIYIDINRLKQIIINLLDNSINNTFNGNILINISNYKKYRILFSIKDTGNGMCKRTKNYISKIIHSYNYNYTINGFGLIITKYLIELMDGKIWFKTSKELGTIFYFYI
jgi:signal transduction histidine kinase